MFYINSAQLKKRADCLSSILLQISCIHCVIYRLRWVRSKKKRPLLKTLTAKSRLRFKNHKMLFKISFAQNFWCHLFCRSRGRGQSRFTPKQQYTYHWSGEIKLFSFSFSFSRCQHHHCHHRWCLCNFLGFPFHSFGGFLSSTHGITHEYWVSVDPMNSK